MKVWKIFLIIIVVILGYLECIIISNFDDITVKTGIIDKNENVVIDFEYDHINAIDLNYNPNFISVEKNDEEYYIDLQGIEDRGGTINFYKNRAPAYSASLKKNGYIDSNIDKISQFIYDDVEESYSEDGYARVEIDEKLGLIDIDGNTILSCKYDNIEVISDAYFLVSKEDEILIIDREEKTIAIFNEDITKFKFKIDPLNDLKDYEEIELEKEIELDKYFWDDIRTIAKNYFLNSHIAIKGDNKIEVFDEFGNKIWEVSGEKIKIEKAGKDIYIYVNQKEEGVIQIIFDENGNELHRFDNFESLDSNKTMYSFSVIDKDRLISYKLTEEDTKIGIIDFSNNIIVEQKYDMIYWDDNGTSRKDFYCVKQGGKYGVIDVDGNTIIKPSYKYKAPIRGNKEYLVVEQYNPLFFTIFFTLALFIFVLIIFLLLKIFKKQKKV